MPLLADPTDHGNTPGSGPLRPGGVPLPGTPDTDDLPSAYAPQAARQRDALVLVRDLWGGTETMREKATLYLPKAPGEDHQNYANRLARTAFFNAFRRSVEGLAGLVFRKDPELGEDVPDVIRQHWENIDNSGTHGDVFAHQLMVEAEAAGHVCILVDFPKTDGAQNARDEMTGEVRPYWVPIYKDQIRSWRTAVVNGKVVLTQLVICEMSYEPKGRFSTEKVERFRVFHNDEGRVWVEVLVVKDKEAFQVPGSVGEYPTQEEIPIAECVTSGKRGMFDSDPPLLDLAHLNVAHYQTWSDYNWSIHKTCVPFIFGAGIAEARDDAGNAVPLVIGANTAVLMPNPDASMQYVAHSGEALGSVKEALDDLKNDMGSLGLAMLAPQKRTAETAEAKRLDKATSDSALAVTARGLQDGIERALGFHARYLKLDTGGSIEINRDFEGLLLDAPVMQAYSTLVAAGFPPRPVLEALQAGGRIPPDANLDELEMEWLVGVQAKRDAAEAAREAFAGEEPEDMAA